MNHFTNRKGYNGIQGAMWVFRARKQRDTYPYGSYFTTLKPSHPNFVRMVRLPKSKQTHVFEFEDEGDLRSLRGPRGQVVYYSPVDYSVDRERQLYSGTVSKWLSEESTSS